MDKLQIQLLGVPHIIIGGTYVTPSHRKAIALLAYLAMDRREHSREALATFFFPEFDTSTGLGEIRRLLYSLNTCIGKKWIQSTRTTLALPHDVLIELDVEHFNEFMLERKDHKHGLDQVCVQCVPILLDTVDLVKGLFMEGYTLTDSPEFDRWQQHKSIHYQDQLDQAVDLLVRYYLYANQLEQALPYARQLLNSDPLREETYYLLMFIEAKANRSSAALHYYENLVRTLQDELGIKPSQKLITLAQTIADKQPLKHSDLDRQIYIESRKAQRNLPATTTNFIGRESELDTIVNYLNDNQRRMITIVGPGGVGKSHLSLMAGIKVEDQFADGVFFIPLAPLTNKIDIIPAIAENVGYQFQQDQRQQHVQLIEYLHNKHMLLIIDNFEHLIAGGAIITELLEQAPYLKILVTSRQRLNQTGETIFSLQGLMVPDSILVEQAERYDAIQLFSYAAQQTQAGFQIQQSNLAAIIDTCQLVQGMPLAIILSASWLTMLTVEEISSEIKNGIDFLAVEMTDLPQRQRSIRAVFDHSWDLLTELEQSVFQQLAVFRGGFTRHAIQTITDTNLHLLMSLTNKSLIQHDKSTRRYYIHELLRQYAEDRLLVSDDMHNTHHRHATYYLNYLVTHGAHLKGKQQLDALRLIEEDYDNIKVAWQWSIEHEQLDMVESVIESLMLYYQLNSRVQEGQNIFEATRAKLQVDHHTTAVYQRLLVRFNLTTDDADVILLRLESALERAISRDDQKESAYCFVKIAELHHHHYHNPEDAIHHYELGIQLYRELDERYYLADALSKLGEAYRLLGNVEKNQVLVQESYRIQLEIDDELGASQTMRALGMATFLAGDYARSLKYCQDALDIQKRANFIAGQVNNGVYVGIVKYFNGKVQEGKQLVEESFYMAEDIGLKSAMGWALASLSTFASVEGDYELAESLIQKADAIQSNPFQQIGAGDSWLKLTKVWAHVLIALGRQRYEVAKELLFPIWKQACETYSTSYLTMFMPIVSILRAHLEPEQISSAIHLLSLTFAQSELGTGFMQYWKQLNQFRSELELIDEELFNTAWEHGQQLELIPTAHQLLNDFWRDDP